MLSVQLAPSGLVQADALDGDRSVEDDVSGFVQFAGGALAEDGKKLVPIAQGLAHRLRGG